MLGSGDGRLEGARATLRLGRDPAQLLALAELEAGQEAVARALGCTRSGSTKIGVR